MKREEAIYLLDNLKGMLEDSHNSDYDTAFKMAIKALEHESILDNVKTEIDRQEKWLLQMHTGYTAYNVDIAFSAIKSVLKGEKWVNIAEELEKDGVFESEENKNDGNN